MLPKLVYRFEPSGENSKTEAITSKSHVYWSAPVAGPRAPLYYPHSQKQEAGHRAKGLPTELNLDGFRYSAEVCRLLYPRVA